MSWGNDASGGLAGFDAGMAGLDAVSADDLNHLLAAWSPDGNTSSGEMSPAPAAGGGGNHGGYGDTWGGKGFGGGCGNKGGSAGGWGGGGWGGGGCMGKSMWSGQGVDKGKSKGKDKGKGAARIAAGEPCYFGKVKSFDVEKKRGYIVCDELFNQCGQDVYVFEKVLSESKGSPGDTVAFFLHWSASGQPQASAPMIRIASAESAALKGTFKPSQDGRGHGFFLCDLTKEFFGRDIYVNKEMAAAMQPGQVVAFNAYLNRDKMPNADKAEAVDQSWEPTPGDLSQSRTDPTVISGAGKGCCKGGAGKDGCMGKGKGEGGCKGKDGAWDGGWDGGGKGGWDGGGKGGKDAAMWAAMQSMWEGGWGGDGWGGDCWGGGCQGKGKDSGGWGGWGGCEGWDSKGKGEKGKSKGNCKGTGEGVPPTPTGETYCGVIKSFNEKNNYGFIASEDVAAKYGGVDCFCSGRYIQGVSVGDMVEFDVGVNSRGQPQAIAVRQPNASGEPDAKKLKMDSMAGMTAMGGMDAASAMTAMAGFDMAALAGMNLVP